MNGSGRVYTWHVKYAPIIRAIAQCLAFSNVIALINDASLAVFGFALLLTEGTGNERKRQNGCQKDLHRFVSDAFVYFVVRLR